MVDLPTAAAVGLLVLGVVGSVVPGVPGPLCSLAGVLAYWWSSGFAAPSPPVLVAFVTVGAVAAAVDAIAGPLAAGAGGASGRTVVAAAIVGAALLFVAGPAGALFGLLATVFVLELRRAGDARASARAATFAAVGVLGSAVVQLLLTGAMLVAFLVYMVG